MIKIEVIGNLFQFHKGAIRTYADLFVKLRKQNFNSIKVRLERSLGYTTTAVLLYFNSIKVRLEHASASSLASSIVYFNSIKVRLELNFGCIEFRLRLFQFHKGAIRTGSKFADAKVNNVFQFHKGAIRTGRTCSCR